MNNRCSVNAYAVVRTGCPIDFRVIDNDELEVSFGDSQHPLTLLFDTESIGMFLQRGTEAMQKMDTNPALDISAGKTDPSESK